jgi:hypothetical protein
LGHCPHAVGVLLWEQSYWLAMRIQYNTHRACRGRWFGSLSSCGCCVDMGPVTVILVGSGSLGLLASLRERLQLSPTFNQGWCSFRISRPGLYERKPGTTCNGAGCTHPIYEHPRSARMRQRRAQQSKPPGCHTCTLGTANHTHTMYLSTPTLNQHYAHTPRQRADTCCSSAHSVPQISIPPSKSPLTTSCGSTSHPFVGGCPSSTAPVLVLM